MHCSAHRCAKFGVAVFKASMQWTGGQSAMGIHALFYIYRSAKFGVVGIQGIYARLGFIHRFMCIVLYIYI